MVVNSQAAADVAGRARLPDGWRRVHFGDIVRNVNDQERDPLQAGIERYVGLEHLDPGSLHVGRWGLVSDGTTFTRRLSKGQVLFPKRRVYQRKVGIAEFDGVCSGDILVFEAKRQELLPELLPFIVESEAFFEHALETSAGSLSPRTRWKDLARYEFPLPPKEEQRRIAEILWTADDYVSRLSEVASSLDALSASIGLRVFGQDGSDRVPLGHLVDAGHIDLQTGPFGTVLKASSYRGSGTPLVNPVHMQEGRLNVSEGPFLGPEDCERLSRFVIKPGDILFARKGDIGRAVLATADHEGFILGSDCIRLRLLTEALLPEYVYRCLTSSFARRSLQRHSWGTTMPGINESSLTRLEIEGRSVGEQRDISHLLERVQVMRASVQEIVKQATCLSLVLRGSVLSGVSTTAGPD